MKFFRHRGCYGLQLFQLGSWTMALWLVPRSTKLAPHYHPGQVVYIFPLFCICTTFNRACQRSAETYRAWPLHRYVTPDGWFHFANKSDPAKERRGPFIFLNAIKWLDGKPKHPSEGFKLA